MICLLAPSKTMDFENDMPFEIGSTRPDFLADSKRIAVAVGGLGPRQIVKVMSASPDIVGRVQKMYSEWSSDGGKPALWAYRGDVYKGMYADRLSVKDAKWAQQHLVIMSGLYGIVRPFDEIQRYRLEMKAPLRIGKYKDLYAFWGDKLAQYVFARTEGVVVNLSSDEYARPVLKHLPKSVRVVTPFFFDKKANGIVANVPIYSKMMRGVMARWIIGERADTPEQLIYFSAHGYAYDPSRSKPDAPAFYREEMKPLQFDT